MSFRLLNISSMYPEYLKSFYYKNPFAKGLSYNENHNLLLEDSSEFVASYTRTFRKLGIEAECVIVNDKNLKGKWRIENGIKAKNNRDVIFEQIRVYQPDILWIDSLSYISKDWLQEVRERVKSIKLIMAYHCAPCNQFILNKLEGVDFLITCTPGIKQDFEKRGLRSYLVYHGFDNDLLSKLNNMNSFPLQDFVFSGSLFLGVDSQGGRLELIEKILEEKIDLSLYVNLEKNCKIRAKQSIYHFNSLLKKIGFGKLISYFPLLEDGDTVIKNYSSNLKKRKLDPLFGIEMYKLLSKARITLNVHGDGARNYAGNMRLFEATGVGSCLLTDNKDNMHELFDINNEVVVYDNIEDCIEKIKWLLENKDRRKQIANAGQQKTLQTHTVENRCKKIIEIINEELRVKD